jgi:transglutaminase-like putative cysteine protease
MCRAAGIPARIAAGVVYADEILGIQNAFGAHLWTQVYLNGKWYGLDATRGGVSSGHIALAFGGGDPTDFYALVNRLGCFEIGAAMPEGLTPAKTAAQKP